MKKQKGLERLERLLRERKTERKKEEEEETL